MMQAEGPTRMLKWSVAAAVMGVALWGVVAMNDDTDRVAFSAKDQEKWATRITRHAREGNLDEAMRLLETSQTQQVLSAYDAKLLHSQLLIEHQQFAKAETLLRGLIATDPQHPAAYNDLAIALSRQGKQQEALDALNSAMRTHDAYQHIYNNIKSLSASLASTSYMKALNLGGEVPAIEMAYLLGNDRAVELQESAIRWPAAQGKTAEVAVADAVETPVESSPPVEQETQALLTALADAKLEAPAAGAPAALTDEPSAPLEEPSAPMTKPSALTQEPSAPIKEPLAPIREPSAPVTQPVKVAEVIPPEPTPVAETEALTATHATAAAESIATSQAAGQDVAAFLQNLTVATDPVTEKAMATLTATPSIAAGTVDAASALAQDETDVQAHVEQWASAWATQNVPAYLASYTADYVSDQHRSHQQWARERKQRIQRAKDIAVELSDMAVEVATPNSASVTFTQVYRSRHYSDVTKKQMSLIKTEQGWQIAQEVSL